MPPASAPVILEPTAWAAAEGSLPLRRLAASRAGSSMPDIEVALTAIHVRRSTTSGARAASGARRRAVAATGSTAEAARARISSTTSAASSGVTSGPGGTSRAPAEAANFQST